MAASKVSLVERIEKTSLKWTAIYPGIFLDYFTPGIKTHIAEAALFIDVKANAAGIPGSGDYPVNFTHSTDVAKYTAGLLSLDKWDTKYYIVGDTKSWKELVAIAEKVKGVKFDVTFDSVEKLQRGEITELPGHVPAYEIFGGAAAKPIFQSVMAQIGVWMQEGLGEYKDSVKYLNEVFADVKALDVENGMKKSYPA